MKHSYIGVKLINAHPMTRAVYNTFRGWKLPEDERGDDEGYLVEYLDGGKPNVPTYKGYVSWSPKAQFEAAYRQITDNSMSFGLAIEAMQKGFKVQRAGWNGKDMFIYYVPANSYPVERNSNNTMAGIYPDDMVPYGAYLAMKTVDGTVVPWLASQTDMLTDDWKIIRATIEDVALGGGLID